MNPKSVSDVISSWPEKPKQLAQQVIDTYGEPQAASDILLIWQGAGSWKQMFLYRDEIEHKFPVPHTDFFEQFIEYQVPFDKFDDLAEFDGSVIVDRTKGLMSARCDSEAHNLIALNLANDIITGAKTVEFARKEYGRLAVLGMMGDEDAYLQDFQFAKRANTADPDETTVAPSMMQAAKQQTPDAVERVKEMFRAA